MKQRSGVYNNKKRIYTKLFYTILFKINLMCVSYQNKFFASSCNSNIKIILILKVLKIKHYYNIKL